MWWVYLDESGDLGFDFITKSPSKVFTITLLLVREQEHNRSILNATKKTIKRKLPNRPNVELKGRNTSLEIKQYFYNLVQSVPFEIYSLTLNKRRVYDYLQNRKDRLYNYLAGRVIQKLPLGAATTRIQLVVDRCKNCDEIKDFNTYLERQLESRLDPRIPLDISHHPSNENGGLQAVDMFSWGLFRKYERRDEAWWTIFRSKIAFEDMYL